MAAMEKIFTEMPGELLLMYVFLVRSTILNDIIITVLNDDVDSILWLNSILMEIDDVICRFEESMKLKNDTDTACEG